jgi:hypothetical protein
MSPIQSTLNSWRNLTNIAQTKRRTETELNFSENENQNQNQHENQEGLPRLVQQHINETSNNNRRWGHELRNKEENHFRIGLRNINSIPTYSKHSKNELMIKDIIDGDFDVFCLTETNVAWHNIPSNDQPSNRFRGKLEFAKYITSNNKDTEYKEKFKAEVR